MHKQTERRYSALLYYCNRVRPPNLTVIKGGAENAESVGGTPENTHLIAQNEHFGGNDWLKGIRDGMPLVGD